MRIERRGSWRRAGRNTFFFLVVGIACYSLGRYTIGQEVENYKLRNAQLSSDNGKLGADVKAAAVQTTNLQEQLAAMKAKYDEVLSSTRNLEIKANETKPMSIASIEIGVIGTPMIDSVNLNVNGKKQVVSAGDVVSVDFTCNIRVLSIDLLKSVARIGSGCAIKP
jgi:hypothetical protein